VETFSDVRMLNITDSFFTNVWRNGRLERVVLQNSGHMEQILIINTGAYTLDFFSLRLK